jgi:hypothetical protein
MVLSLEPDSNVNSDRDEHSKKHFSPKISIQAGIQMDLSSKEDVNAYRPISVKGKVPTGSMMTFAKRPKYRINVIPWTPIRNGPETK